MNPPAPVTSTVLPIAGPSLIRSTRPEGRHPTVFPDAGQRESLAETGSPYAGKNLDSNCPDRVFPLKAPYPAADNV